MLTPQAGLPPAPMQPAPATEGPVPMTPATGEPAPPSDRVRVALLLPLSGPSAPLGRAILDAAQMAVFDVADDRFELLPRDTAGSPDGAVQAASAALGSGAQLILGPLLQGEVEAVKPVARQAGVPIVAFSTATQLAGDGTYLMGFLPQQQVQRVAAFARENGATRFAALAPATPYGDLVVETLRQAVAAGGGTLARNESYDPAAVDLTPAVRRLAGGEFDAIMLPEGGPKLKAVASLLPYYDIEPGKVHVLGTGLWDEPGLGAEPALVGGWYAASPPEARGDFDQRFQKLNKRRPPRLATLGYDAGALAAVLGRQGGFSQAAIENPSGFAGLDGIFRFLPSGQVQRGLAVLEVQRSGVKVVSPAPETFEDFAF